MTAINSVGIESRVAIDQTESMRLEHGDIYCLPYKALGIRVISGIAWITSQAEDYALEADDQMMIPRQPHTVIVSAVGHRPLCFEPLRL